MYRAAMIGCGMIGSSFADDPRVDGIYSHAGAYAACPDTELVAVCDVNAEALARCGARWGVAARYQSADVLLAEQRPDIVSVCTPDATHFDLIRLAIESPGVRGVLAEKPLALDRGQGEALVRAARERGVTLAVNYSRRYVTSHVELRERIRGGEFGVIQTLGGVYTKGTFHNGTHWFDLARFLAGEVTNVWGFDFRGEIGPDPTLDAVLQFESGAGAHLQACESAAFSLFEMDVIGTRGRARLVESGHTVEIHRVVDSPYHTGYRTLAVETTATLGMRDTLLHAVADLVRCVSSGTVPLCSGEDGVAAVAVAAAVRESARTGRRTAVSRC